VFSFPQQQASTNIRRNHRPRRRHDRPRNRHEEFPQRLLGHALQPRHAADGQERNVARPDAEPLRRQRMPKLMGHDARKQRQLKDDAVDRGQKTSRTRSVDICNPRHDQHERPVDVDADARNRRDFP
jgi:hypothetical protein